MAAPSLRALGTVVATTTASPSFAAPAGAVSTDVILVGIFLDDGRNTIAAGGVPTGFTLAPNLRQVNDAAAGSPSHSLYVYWGRFSDVGAGPYGFTVTTGGGGASFVEGRAAAIKDCITTGDPFEATNGATSGNTNVTTAPSVSATSLDVDRYAFYVATNWTGGAWTPATGFTEQWDANDEIITFDDLALATAQTVTPQAVCVGSGRSNAWVGILLPVPAAGDLGGRASTGFHPGKGPTRARFYYPVRFDAPTGTQVTSDTGLAELGVAATSVVAKVAVVTAAAALGVAASGAGKKITADTGQANVGLSANAIHVQISADTGVAELGLAATVATVKVAKVTGVASVGLSATGTAKKISKDTGTAAAGLSSADTAAKVSKDTGTAALGLSANAVRVPIRAETGTATLGVAAQVATKKILAASAVASVGVASSATARKVAKASQAAALGVCSIGTARKVSKDTGAAYAGVVARFAGIDLRAVTARSVLALRAQQHQCTTYRSNIGTTTRPAGTTARPFTGTTSKPC